MTDARFAEIKAFIRPALANRDLIEELVAEVESLRQSEEELLAVLRQAEHFFTHMINAPLGTRIADRKALLPKLRAAISKGHAQ